MYNHAGCYRTWSSPGWWYLNKTHVSPVSFPIYQKKWNIYICLIHLVSSPVSTLVIKCCFARKSLCKWHVPFFDVRVVLAMSPSRPGRPKDFSIPLRIEYGEIVVDAFCDRLAIREAHLKPQLACYWVGIYPLFVFCCIANWKSQCLMLHRQ